MKTTQQKHHKGRGNSRLSFSFLPLCSRPLKLLAGLERLMHCFNRRKTIKSFSGGVFLLVALASVGCSYTSHTTRLEPAIDRVVPEARYVSKFELLPEGEKTASIGDELFRIFRYLVGGKEHIGYRAPTERAFPDDAVWRGTHVFDGGESGKLTVYTTPKYYNGNIGVILDSDGRPATKAPLVQLAGGKTGKRWQLSGSGPFFVLHQVLVERWGIRYGGKKDGNYVFELLNKNEANVVEIIQSIEIDERDFLDGFTVRGVFIKGLRKDVQGVIKYKVIDRLTS